MKSKAIGSVFRFSLKMIDLSLINIEERAPKTILFTTTKFAPGSAEPAQMSNWR